jgi:PqqD family protein of HPr-rel-A system
MDARRWRLAHRARLRWRKLDDEWVVFDSGSGDTHRLDAISAAVLVCLELDAQDVEGLSQLLASELHLPGKDLLGRLESLLDQLCRLGLIEATEV